VFVDDLQQPRPELRSIRTGHENGTVRMVRCRAGRRGISCDDQPVDTECDEVGPDDVDEFDPSTTRGDKDVEMWQWSVLVSAVEACVIRLGLTASRRRCPRRSDHGGPVRSPNSHALLSRLVRGSRGLSPQPAAARSGHRAHALRR
jgi:hypothetical protein